MRIRKTIKRIAAIGMGAALLGATVLGAAAAEKFGVAVEADTAAATKLTESTGGTGGATDEIYISKGIASTTTGFGKQSWDDNDLDGLKDSSIVYDGDSIDYRDELYFANTGDPSIQASLTVSDVDYETDVAFEIAAEERIGYYFLFDEAVNVTKASSTVKLKIPFMGQTLKITDYTDENTFTATVGDEYSLDAGEERSIIDKSGITHKIKLLRTSDTDGVFEIDGEQYTISESETVSLSEIFQVELDTAIGAAGSEGSFATVVVGEYTSKTFNDEDEYIDYCTIEATKADCTDTNPDWKWDIGMLSAQTTKGDHTEASGGPTIGVRNAFALDDADDNNVVGTGSFCLPHDFICVSLDGLTVTDTDYMRLTLEGNKNKNVDGSGGSEVGLYLKVDEDEGMIIDEDNGGFDITSPLTSNPGTGEIFLYPTGGGANLSVYYKDQGVWTLAGIMNGSADSQASIGYLDYKDTTGNDVLIDVRSDEANNELHVCLNDTETNLAGTTDDLCFEFYSDSVNSIDRLGISATAAAADVEYGGIGGTGYGTKDEDLRTAYGLIIYDPEGNNDNEKVVIDVPGDVVKADVTLYGPGGLGTTAKVDKVESPDTVTVTEGSILVGGPAANKLTAEAMGLDFPTYGPDLDGWTDGYCYISAGTSGDSAVTIIAGWDKEDTLACVEKYLAGTTSYAGTL